MNFGSYNLRQWQGTLDWLTLAVKGGGSTSPKHSWGLSFSGLWRMQSCKLHYPSSLHGTITQKTTILISVITSNLVSIQTYQLCMPLKERVNAEHMGYTFFHSRAGSCANRENCQQQVHAYRQVDELFSLSVALERERWKEGRSL